MSDQLQEQKFKQIVDNYYDSIYFDLIAKYINQLDILQQENKYLKERYEFVTTISHQLRTPISAIKMGLESIRGQDKDQEMLKSTYVKADNLSSLVNTLLYYSEIGDDYQIRKRKVFFLSQAIQKALETLKPKIEAKKINIEFAKPQFKDQVSADQNAINKIIYFVLDNAITYNKENGRINIKISKEDREIKISIQDTGIGIPQKEQNKVFQKFFRATNASLGKNEGSGISLYLAKMITQKHMGKINFTSKENQGSTFYFTLPIKLK